MTVTSAPAQAPVAAPCAKTIYLVGTAKVAVLRSEQVEALIEAADYLDSQRSRMTQQADRLDAVVTFAHRLRTALAAASGSAVRLDLEPIEEEMASFLVLQSHAWATHKERTRSRHTCRVCGRSRLSNPAWERYLEREAKKDAAVKTLTSASGVYTGWHGYYKTKHRNATYECLYCWALDTDEARVVFCPNCKTMADTPVLKQCAKCRYGFTSSSALNDVWRPADAVAVPPPAGERLSEIRLADEPTRVIFLPSGGRMLTASRARSVQMWDVSDPTGPPGVLWTAPVGGIVKITRPILALSPDEQWVAVANPQQPRVRLLRAADGAEASTISWSLADGGTPSAVAFWPDGSALLVANADIDFWSTSGQRFNRLPVGSMSSASHVAIGPDAALVAAVVNSVASHRVFVWRSSDGAVLGKIAVPGPIGDLVWTPQPDVLALAVGNAAWLVQVPSGNRLTQFTVDAEITAIAVSAAGTLLATASKDRSARVFDLRSAIEIARISRPTTVTTVAFAADGRLAIGDESNVVQFWAPPQETSAPVSEP